MINATATVYVNDKSIDREALKIIAMVRYVYKDSMLVYVNDTEETLEHILSVDREHSYFVGCDNVPLSNVDKRVLLSTTDVKNKISGYVDSMPTHLDALFRYTFHDRLLNEKEKSFCQTQHELGYSIFQGFYRVGNVHGGLIFIQNYYKLLLDSLLEQKMFAEAVVST